MNPKASAAALRHARRLAVDSSRPPLAAASRASGRRGRHEAGGASTYRKGKHIGGGSTRSAARRRPPRSRCTRNARTDFSVFLGLIFFLELTAGILAFVFKDWIKDQLNLFINKNVQAYRDDIDLQNVIDFAQEYITADNCRTALERIRSSDATQADPGQADPGQADPGQAPQSCLETRSEHKHWSCCGAHGSDDWNLNMYFNCTALNPSRESCGVPFSCCVKDPAVPEPERKPAAGAPPSGGVRG
ncbi:Tetraspanin-17 [Liparis tanakae]|uniref:Tetraspanin-17 n=1 Tax=Liparis tanakae TaxID=230148 RepID=A0A4Z2EEI9_9TELE|nr:Tetraspanin-17 [Liparis tanakae]